jgi:uridine kinase
MTDFDVIVYEINKKKEKAIIEDEKRIQLEIPSYDYYEEKTQVSKETPKEPRRVIIIDL